MGNKSPEIEFINLQHLAQKKEHCQGRPALESLKKLANSALKKGPFSVTFEKQDPHIAASGDPKDFLSYAPYVNNIVALSVMPSQRSPFLSCSSDIGGP